MSAPPERVTDEEVREISAILRALGDRTRLQICFACLNSPLTVAEIAKRVGVSPSLVSHHMRPLRDLGLLRDEREGRQILYSHNKPYIRRLLVDLLKNVRSES